MRNRILSWLASLRVRLIITYVMVTVFSFFLLNLLLVKPVEGYLMRREEHNLRNLALVFGDTINTPWRVSPEIWQRDLFWTQRRCNDLVPKFDARIRLVGADGTVLTDSCWSYPHELIDWQRMREHASVNIGTRDEVARAMHGHYAMTKRREEGKPNGRATLYVAQPILRRAADGQGQDTAFILYLNKPVDSVRSNVHELQQLITTGMLAALLVIVLVSIVLSGNLSAGIRNAMMAARAFAAGQLDRRMRATGRDEVGQLGAAFNQMADALQRQEQIRRNLLADVSHELRTPLTAIAGCADTLTDGTLRDDPETAERFLGIIIKESARLQRLVSDILELSKLQAGAVAIPRAPLAILPLIVDAVEIARTHARQEDLRICCESDGTPEDALLVLGNEDRLAQALRNLLDNARHHTPSGGAITVTLTAQPETVTIHVRDEGEGIPPDELPWVFDRFYRAGKGPGKPGGTGLGLAIVREIIQAHAGRITVESVVGQGTTFSLHLPRVVQAESPSL